MLLHLKQYVLIPPGIISYQRFTVQYYENNFLNTWLGSMFKMFQQSNTSILFIILTCRKENFKQIPRRSVFLTLFKVYSNIISCNLRKWLSKLPLKIETSLSGDSWFVFLNLSYLHGFIVFLGQELKLYKDSAKRYLCIDDFDIFISIYK